jgi:hypothetical protein
MTLSREADAKRKREARSKLTNAEKKEEFSRRPSARLNASPADKANAKADAASSKKRARLIKKAEESDVYRADRSRMQL